MWGGNGRPPNRPPPSTNKTGGALCPPLNYISTLVLVYRTKGLRPLWCIGPRPYDRRARAPRALPAGSLLESESQVYDLCPLGLYKLPVGDILTHLIVGINIPLRGVIESITQVGVSEGLGTLNGGKGNLQHGPTIGGLPGILNTHNRVGRLNRAGKRGAHRLPDICVSFGAKVEAETELVAHRVGLGFVHEYNIHRIVGAWGLW